MSNIIEVRSLVKRFGDIAAVDGISFDVKAGDLFAFLGPNGAGKSTTINMLCTLIKQDSGTIEVCGLRSGRNDQLIRRRIGVVFQENCLDDLLTVRQNLFFRACLYETDKKKIRQSLDYVCEVLHTGDLLDRTFGKLSGGQKRRCEIARALMHSPEILFLDEPSSGLDPQTRNNVWECIEQLRNEHKTTVFLTTHYMEEAAGADSIAIIDAGKIAAIGTPAELKERYTADVLKVASGSEYSVRSVLDEFNLGYREKAGLFHVDIPDSLKALDVLKRIEYCVTSFEVLHGTMDDVFLNITGKSLRED